MVRLLIACLIFVSSTAFAATDFIATYTYEDGNKITIATRDSQHVRMTTSEKNYMLLKEGKVYSVSQDDDGHWQVMDMDQMKAFQSSGMTGMFSNTSKTQFDVVYDDTGMEETIAGYTGTVYQVKVLENGKPVEEKDAVLCKHSDLKKLNEGWSAINAKMGQSLGQDMAKAIENATNKAKEAGYGGMLRYGNDMRLSQLKKTTLDASYYQIPKGARFVNIGQQPPSSPEAVELSQGTDSMDEEEQADENTTEEELKKGVQKLFKGLFN